MGNINIKINNMNRDPQRFTRTPYFENPEWFTEPVVGENGKVLEPSRNFYYDSKIKTAGENHVFMLEEDIETQGKESSVVFEKNQTFCLFFEDNPDNVYNRQYVETIDNKWYDTNGGFEFNIGDRYRSSKIQRIVDFNDFCAYLSTNKHNKVLKQLLTKI